MTKIGQKIIRRLQNFANKLSQANRGNNIPLELYEMGENRKEIGLGLNNSKLNRDTYLQLCKQENIRLRQSYGPILITYIRKPQKLVLPPHKMNNDELIKFYRTNFQNTPIGCVVALRIDGDIHFGWSLCNKKDRFNKIICLNRAINRCFKDDLSTDAPPLVQNYLDRLWERANKYFKSTT